MTTPSGWACDTCAAPIELPDDGVVIWRAGPNDPYDQIRLVHKDPKKSCQPPVGIWSSVELTYLVGDAGLARLLSWLSDGPLGGKPGGRGVEDLDGYVDLVRRLHTPWDEQARRWLDDDQATRDVLVHPNEYSPYEPEALLRIAQARRTG